MLKSGDPISMRMSRFFNRTLRIEATHYKSKHAYLLEKGGFIRRQSKTGYYILPLGKRCQRNLENLLRKEINCLVAHEIEIDPNIFSSDIDGRRNWPLDPMLEMVSREINSYRQLPQILYQTGTKLPGSESQGSWLGGLPYRVLQNLILAPDRDTAAALIEQLTETWLKVFKDLDLPVSLLQVSSDMGEMPNSREFFLPTIAGEDWILTCSGCGYKANQKVAGFQKIPGPQESPKEMEKVHTPDSSTIDQLCVYLGIVPEKTAKAMFLTANVHHQESETFVLAVIRGDMDLNLFKLAGLLNATDLSPASEEQIIAAGAQPGYGSPVGVKNTLIVVDDMIPGLTNLVAGANQYGYHYKNVNFNRDYKADLVGDITTGKENSPCPECGGKMKAIQGLVLGYLQEPVTNDSQKKGCLYLDREGREQPVLAGIGEINISGMMAGIAEVHNDENGLIWPPLAAPYQVYFVLIDSKDGKVSRAGDQIYEELQAGGIKVLYDDRKERAGVKFKDADLFGIPLRVTLSEKTLNKNCIEFKFRNGKELIDISINKLEDFLKEKILSFNKG